MAKKCERARLGCVLGAFPNACTRKCLFQRDQHEQRHHFIGSLRKDVQKLVKRVLPGVIFNHAPGHAQINADDAEDIAQNASLKIYTNLLQFRGEAGFHAWLRTIAHNECVTFYRKRPPDTASLDSPTHSLHPHSEDTRHESPDAAAQRLDVEQAMDALPPRSKELIERYFIHEMTCHEIARLERRDGRRASKSSVHRDLQDALKKLRNYLNEGGEADEM